MSQKDTFIHLVAGGVGGTAGAIATCPLEVVKTRLQSSYAHFTNHLKTNGKTLLSEGNSGVSNGSPRREQRLRFSTCSSCKAAHLFTIADSGPMPGGRPSNMGVMKCLRYIIEKEGPTALFKGLGPNLIGVAPSRAIYFSSYSKAKAFFNSVLTPDSPIVHIFSAASAGFVACTLTNPIWFVKTRLQLDQEHAGKKLSTLQCVKRIYQQGGVVGFYKGITASYYGISETVVHFVIYEAIKAKLQEYRTRRTNGNGDHKSSRDFFEFMFAGAVSKTVASTLAYPHEVARTRLREEGNKYKGFWQTLSTVLREEGYRGLYRGLTTQLIRQIPNTAIMMSTYEAVVYMLTTYTSRDSGYQEESYYAEQRHLQSVRHQNRDEED